MGLYQKAEEDSTAALQAGPNAKALLRRGTARSLMFKHQDAIQDFRHVLSLEPNNRLPYVRVPYLTVESSVPSSCDLHKHYLLDSQSFRYSCGSFLGALPYLGVLAFARGDFHLQFSP